jgi:hypothetical protein
MTITTPSGEMAGNVRAPAHELLSDVPIVDPKQDRLGFRAYAEALAELIDNPSVATPLTLSIDAPWGAGKSSLARLIERMLCVWPQDRGERPHIVVWFNAWMHSHAPDLGTALAAAVGKAVATHRPVWRRILQPLPAAILSPEERRRRRALWLLAAVALAVIVAFLPHTVKLFNLSENTDRWAGLGVLAFVPVGAAAFTGIVGVAQSAAKFIQDPGDQASTGSMGDVERQFARLVESATRGQRRLVIFVDDLDRCPPDRALALCDTASLLLAVPGVVTVLLGDLAGLRAFAAHQFAAAGDAPPDTPPDADPGEEYGRHYLDKIVQLDFFLPPSGTQSLVKLLRQVQSAPVPTSTPAPGGRGCRARRSRPLGPVRSRAQRLFVLVCGRPRRFVAFVGISSLVALTLLGVLAAVDQDYSNSGTNFGVVLGGVWVLLTGAAWVLAAAGTAYSWVRQQRARRQTAKVDAAIREQAPEQASVEAIKQIVSQSVTQVSERLVEQRARRVRVQRLVAEGGDELAANLPNLPRSVKRVANRHYLLASVAVCRESVGQDSPVTAAQLAKWAVLMERWPLVAAAIIQRPALAGELERAARVAGPSGTGGNGAGELPKALQDEADQDALLRLLGDPVSLGDVAERLVYSLPAHSGG